MYLSLKLQIDYAYGHIFFLIETIILVIYFTKNICGFVVTWQIMVTLIHSWIESGTFFTSNKSKSEKKYLISFMGQN